ncbi:MAG: DUF4136 domain-containing protein [Candidatus Sulfotelmatobacter sp.]
MAACAMVFALLLPLNAHSQQVSTDWDHNVHNFASFKTYQLVKPVRSTGNPLMDQRIITAIDAQMAQKGFQHVDTNPDVFVTYGTGLQRQRSATATGMGRLRMGGGLGTINENISNAGTLVVDISNAQTKQLLWRGTATDTLSDKPDKNSQKIAKAVAKMFKKYPPESK